MGISLEAELAMFVPFPSPTYIAEIESAFDLNRKRRRSTSQGSWLVSESLATVAIAGDPATITVSIGEAIHEEHYVSTLSYARLQSSVIVASYTLQEMKQKFALRFLRPSDADKCFKALQVANTQRFPFTTVQAAFGGQSTSKAGRSMECLMKVLFQPDDQPQPQPQPQPQQDGLLRITNGEERPQSDAVVVSGDIEGPKSFARRRPRNVSRRKAFSRGDTTVEPSGEGDTTPQPPNVQPSSTPGARPSLTPAGTFPTFPAAPTVPTSDPENVTLASKSNPGLAEEVVACLMDPTFPAFVKEVGKVWSDLERTTAALKFTA